jgi:hypothetical protein
MSVSVLSSKFDVYKTRFTKKEKMVRKELDQLSLNIEKHRHAMSQGNDVEGQSQMLQQQAKRVQTLVDQLDDCLNHMQKHADSKQYKSTILRFK